MKAATTTRAGSKLVRMRSLSKNLKQLETLLSYRLPIRTIFHQKKRLHPMVAGLVDEEMRAKLMKGTENG